MIFPQTAKIHTVSLPLSEADSSPDLDDCENINPVIAAIRQPRRIVISVFFVRFIFIIIHPTARLCKHFSNGRF